LPPTATGRPGGDGTDARNNAARAAARGADVWWLGAGASAIALAPAITLVATSDATVPVRFVVRIMNAAPPGRCETAPILRSGPSYRSKSGVFTSEIQCMMHDHRERAFRRGDGVDAQKPITSEPSGSHGSPRAGQESVWPATYTPPSPS